MVVVFKNVWDNSTAKNYDRVSLLSVVSKTTGKLINIRLVDQFDECGFLSVFQYDFSGLLYQLQIYLSHSTGFDMLVFFTNLSLIEFEYLWMESFSKNVLLILYSLRFNSWFCSFRTIQ